MNLTYTGSGISTESMLDGTYDSGDLEESTRLFLQNLQQKTLQELPNNITTEDALGKLKNWLKKTTASPSGLH